MSKLAANEEFDVIVKACERKDGQINPMESGFTRLADVAEEISRKCIESVFKRPFYLQASFWTAFIAVSGLLGLILTWQQQVKAVEVANIQKQIVTIEDFRAQENQAIAKMRILIINQTLNCPIKSNLEIVQLQKARNRSLIDILAYTSNLSFSTNPRAKAKITNIISTVYSLPPKSICQINAKKFDKKLEDLQAELNTIVDYDIKMKQDRVFDLESKFRV